MRPRLLPFVFAVASSLWPVGAEAQQQKSPVVGFLGISNPERAAGWLADWHRGLSKEGFVEGRNLAVEYRWADSDRSRVPALVAELIGRRVDAFATPDPGAATTAKKSTTIVPIVFVHVADPVAMGLVESHNRPGGNVTGVANFEGLIGKKLEALRDLVPAATRIGYLVDHKSSFWPGELEGVLQAGKTLGLEVVLLPAEQPHEIEPALAAAKGMGLGAILVQSPSTLFFAERERILQLLGREAFPSTCPPGGGSQHPGLPFSRLFGAEIRAELQGGHQSTAFTDLSWKHSVGTPLLMIRHSSGQEDKDRGRRFQGALPEARPTMAQFVGRALPEGSDGSGTARPAHP